jgi:NADPH2:quinone reductase
MRAGTYSGQELPFVMGMECAGVVEAVGGGVTGFAPGDRVFGRARGAHATHVLVDAVNALPLPASLDFIEGAAIPVGWLTAWHALVTVAKARAGERVLIEAIASSVGSAALQIAKWQGCWVAGTASRDDKCRRGVAAGADAAYNYKTADLPAEVMRDTQDHGIDIGLMTIGEETATALFDSMAAEGRIVMYGSTGGRKVCFSLNIGMRNLQLLAMSISSSARFLPESMVSFREVALPLFASGRFKAVVDTVLPMRELAAAHAMVDSRTHYGKVVLVND